MFPLVLVLLTSALCNAQTPSQATSTPTAWSKHFNADGSDVCDSNPNDPVCSCPCDSDLITITQTLSGSVSCIAPSSALLSATYDATGRSSSRCIHIGLTPVDGVCGTSKKCSTTANYLNQKPACSVSSATDGEKCIKVDNTGRTTYVQAERFCTEAGMRMCSLFEVQNGKHLKHADECGLSAEYVWTKTQCTGTSIHCTTSTSNDNGESNYVSTTSRANSPLGQVHCVGKEQDTTDMSKASSRPTGDPLNIVPRNIYPSCCADADDASERWTLAADDHKDASCGHEVDTTGWSDARQLPWNAQDTGYKSSSVFAGSGTPSNAASTWNQGCDNRLPPVSSAGKDTAAACRTMHGPFFNNQITMKEFTVPANKALKLTLRAFANDKWPASGTRKYTIRLKKGAQASNPTTIKEWVQTRSSSNDCHSDPNWEASTNGDTVWEPGKVRWSSNPTGGICSKYVEMTVPGSINNDPNGKVVVEVICNSYFGSIPNNWQTTSSNQEINVAYCGFDMVQLWTTDDTLDDDAVTSADFNWGTTVMVQTFQDFTASTKNTNKKTIEMYGSALNGGYTVSHADINTATLNTPTTGTTTLAINSNNIVAPAGTPVEQNGALGTLHTALNGAGSTSILITVQSGTFVTSTHDLQIGGWVYQKGLTPGARTVVTLPESGSYAPRIVYGPGAAYNTFNSNGYRQCASSSVNPCAEIHVGFNAGLNVQSISRTFVIGTHGNSPGNRNGKINIKFKAWAVDSWDNGELSWLSIDDSSTKSWQGAAKECVWRDAAVLGDITPIQSTTWKRDMDVDVYQPWGGNRGYVCTVDVDLWVDVPNDKTTIKLDFQSTVDQSPGDEWWGFSHLEINTATIGATDNSCPGFSCPENCLNLPGSADTSSGMGLCASETDCALRTWPTAAECVNPKGVFGTCVPSPRGNAVGTYSSTCNMCGGDFWCARNEADAWPVFSFNDPARDATLIATDNVMNREVTRMSVLAHGSMGADGITASNYAQLTLNGIAFTSVAHRMSGAGVDGKWQCGDCFESSKIELDGTDVLPNYNYGSGVSNSLRVLPSTDAAWCVSKITLKICARPGPAVITSIANVGTSTTHSLNPSGGDRVTLNGENLGPILTSISFGPDGYGFVVLPADCDVPASPYTSLTCTIPKGIGSNHRWRVKSNKVRISDASADATGSTTSYTNLATPVLSYAVACSVSPAIATCGLTEGSQVLRLGSSDAASPYPTNLLSDPDLQVQATVRVAKPTYLKVSQIVIAGTTATVTHDSVSPVTLSSGDKVCLSNLGYSDVTMLGLEGKEWTVTNTPSGTSFQFNPTNPTPTTPVSDATYTMNVGHRALAWFWPASDTNYDKHEVLPSVDSTTQNFQIISDPMSDRGMAILGVKVQVYMIATGEQGTLGESASLWTTYTYTDPKVGAGVRTEADALNTFTFFVEGNNFGTTDLTLSAPGSAKLCKSSDQTTAGNGACVVVAPTTWSHKGASFTRSNSEWLASDFPGTLQLTVGDRLTTVLTVLQTPPSLIDDINTDEVRNKVAGTDGMLDLESGVRVRDRFRLNIFNVGNGVGTDLEDQLVIYIEIDSSTTLSLYGCTSENTPAGCTPMAEAPSSLQGSNGGWSLNACSGSTNCTVTVYIPEGEGTNLPLYVSYGGAASNTITFLGYVAPSIEFTELGTQQVSGLPFLGDCGVGRLDATGGVLDITGNNFGLSPTFEFCVVEPSCSLQAVECCKERWTLHAGTSSSATQHTQLAATIAPGVGEKHLVRVTVGGQSSSPAAVCFKAPVVTLVATVPDPLSTGASPFDKNAGSPGKIVIQGKNFGSLTSLGWANDASRGHYQALYKSAVCPGGSGATYHTQVLVDTLESCGDVSSPVLTVTDSQIEFALPAGEGANHAVTVKVGGQLSTTSQNFAYAPPNIVSISPPYGPTDGSQPITINGTNFGTQSSVITVNYYYETFTFSRAFSYSEHSHDHRQISNIPMPAGQGKSNVRVTVTVNGQTSAAYTITPPPTKVAVEGYPNPVAISGAYLPPRVDSMAPPSGPTSGCNEFEAASDWRKNPTVKRKCGEDAMILFTGVSFGLGGTAGNTQVEMRELGETWSSADTTCELPTCLIIASDMTTYTLRIKGETHTVHQILEHTHNTLRIKAPRGLGSNRKLRVRVGDQLLPGNEQTYNFEPPKDMAFTPLPVDALGSTLEITADDGFGETNSSVTLTIGGKACENAMWKPLHTELGRPYLECNPVADVAGVKDIILNVALTEHVYPVSSYKMFNRSEMFSICMGGETDLRTGETQRYYGRPCNAMGSSIASSSFFNPTPCVSDQPWHLNGQYKSGKGERCLPCPEGAICYTPGLPWRYNTGREFTYFDPTSKKGFWRSRLFHKEDAAEIQVRKYPKARFDTVEQTVVCNALEPTDAGCPDINEACKLYNRTTETSSNSFESSLECVDKEYPLMSNKQFVFDYVPCEPPEACLGNNECRIGYEGNLHSCNNWYAKNKQGDDETSIRSCRSDYDCKTKSGELQVLSTCSPSRPQDCALCDFSNATNDTATGILLGQCRCNAGGERCGT